MVEDKNGGDQRDSMNERLQGFCIDFSRKDNLNPKGLENPLEGPIGKAEYQVEEANAVLDAMAEETEALRSTLVPQLVENSTQLAVTFAKIDLIQDVLERVEKTLSELEARSADIQKAATTIYNPTSVTQILRNFNLKKRPSLDEDQVPSQNLERLKWKPLQSPVPDPKDLLHQLETLRGE